MIVKLVDVPENDRQSERAGDRRGVVAGESHRLGDVGTDGCPRADRHPGRDCRWCVGTEPRRAVENLVIGKSQGVLAARPGMTVNEIVRASTLKLDRGLARR